MTTAEAIVSADGELAVPAAIREKLGLQPGDRVQFDVDDLGRITAESVSKSDEELLRAVEARGTWETSDEWHAVRRRAYDEHFARKYGNRP